MRMICSVLLLTAACAAFCQPGRAQDDRANYVSDASFVIGTYKPQNIGHSPERIATQANQFLQALDDKLRSRVQQTLDSAARRDWTNLPARPDAAGAPIGELNTEQIEALCQLMANLFSQQGYDKMCRIMLADDQLLDGGRPRQGFGTEQYSVVIFGEPSPTEPWAFQLNGHHIGVNVAMNGEKMTLSPSHIGTQPESFQIGSETIRPLAGETDEAFKLVASLSEEQFKKALTSPRRGQIVTGPGNDNRIPDRAGISCSTFSDEQQQILMALISHWLGNLPSEPAQERLNQLIGEVEQMNFAWYGPRTSGSDVSYRIQGPSLIIEYACQDLGGVPTNHLHTNYRDPTNEYGKQIDRP